MSSNGSCSVIALCHRLDRTGSTVFGSLVRISHISDKAFRAARTGGFRICGRLVSLSAAYQRVIRSE